MTIIGLLVIGTVAGFLARLVARPQLLPSRHVVTIVGLGNVARAAPWRGSPERHLRSFAGSVGGRYALPFVF